MLNATDPLRRAPRRVLIAGVTGAGKTTLAVALAARLQVPHTDIDALYHGPNWTRREEFHDDVDAMLASPGWITEWQYRSARPRLAAGADTLIWLDFPVRLWLPRLVRRTIQRRARREVLWAGNVEAPLWHFFTGRDHVIAWALRTYRDYPDLVATVEATHPQLQVMRLRSQRDVDRLLARLPPG